MVSWKLCVVLLVFVVLTLALDVESGRGGGGGRGNRRQGSSRPNRNRNNRRGGAGNPSRRRGGGGGRRRGPGRLSRNIERLTPQQKTMLIDGLVSSSNEFGLDIYNQMKTRHTDNFFFSPLSIFSALSMVQMGSTSRTKRQLRRSLHYHQSVHVPTAIKLYTTDMMAGNTSTVVKAANAVYKREGIAIVPRFETHVQFYFGSEVKTLADPNPEQDINNWVEEKTNGEIVDFLEEGSISDDTILYLINAIYFKGMWSNPFEPEQSAFADFRVSDTETHQVIMMTRQGEYRIRGDDELQAIFIEVPYENERFAMYIILPNEGTTLGDVEGNLTHDRLTAALTQTASSDKMDMILSMPKFGLDTKQELKEVLRALGIQNLFSMGANLRKISRGRGSTVYVSEVSHRAVIEVDEEGTVAAAVTGVAVNAFSMPMTYTANRPFAFVLRDRVKGVNFFMGRFVNPMGNNLKV